MNALKVATAFLITTLVLCIAWVVIVLTDSIPGELRFRITLILGIVIASCLTVAVVIYVVKTRKN